MGSLIFLFLFTSGFFKNAGLTFVHPLSFIFSSSDTVYIFTKDKIIFRAIVKNERLVKLDSILINIPEIKDGYFDGKNIFVINNKGLYRGNKRGNFELIEKGKIKDISGISEYTFILFNKKMQIRKKGEKIKEILVSDKFTFIEPFDSNRIFLSGKGRVLIIDLRNNRKLFEYENKRFQDFNEEELAKLKKNIKILKFKHFTIQRNKIYIVAGWKIKDGEKESLILKIDSNYNVEKEKTLDFIVNSIVKTENFIIAGGYKDDFEGKIYFLEPENLQIKERVEDAFRILSLELIDNTYLLASRYAGGYLLLNTTNIHKIYTEEFYRYISRLMGLNKAEKKDFNNDGIIDFLWGGSTIWRGPEDKKVNIVILIINKIPIAKKSIFEYVKKAQKYNNILKADKALYYIDEAIMHSDLLMPESLESLFKLREQIYWKLKLKRNLRKAGFFILHSIPIISFFILVILAIFSFWKKIEHRKSPPTGEILREILKIPVIHKFLSWEDYINKMEEIDHSKLEYIKSGVEDSLRLLNSQNISTSFRNSPVEWRRIYKRIIRELKLLNLYLNLYSKNKKGSFRRKILKSLVIKSILILKKLRKTLLEKIEKEKGDIIKDALLSAVEDMKNRYRGEALIRTKIESTSSYRFFKDEILKFKNAFYSIIENAIESYENKIRKVVDITVDSDPERILINIRDYGKGITEKELEYIFTPGYSTKGKGRGHGLNNVDKFFEKYGELKIRSELNKGTEFTIILPFENKK